MSNKMSLYSDMTHEELQVELDKLKIEGQQAYDHEDWSEYHVLMTKWYLAKSYQNRSSIQIQIGRSYRLTEDYDQLTVSRIEGVMAWGRLLSNGLEKAFPIAMLAEHD